MSKDNGSKTLIALRFFPGLVTLIVLLFTLTGNCSTCGFDKDYLGAVVGLEPVQR